MKNQQSFQRVSTGIPGLDEITFGGLIAQRTYLVRGGPGAGKTTIGLHFLKAGANNGEKTLFITLEEPEEHIKKNAQLRGIDIKDINFLDISPTSEFFTEIQTYDIFAPAEVEREPITKKIVEKVKALKPQRVFLDPMTQFRYLTADVFQFRKQVLSFLRFLIEQGATVVFTSEGSAEAPDDDLQFMSDGVIYIAMSSDSRTISVTKFRGSDFRAGNHSIKLSSAGIEVFPRLMPIGQKKEFTFEKISSGIPDLDELLNGGIERGTVTLITGPTGVGKTTIGLQFMKEAAGRGERSTVYSFEEEIDVMLKRCDSVGITARSMMNKGTLNIHKIEPLQYSPDEFAQLVRHDVENKDTKIVMIDSIAGYKLTLKGEDIQSRLHALVKYLQNLGVVVFIVNEVEAITGDFRATDIGISYLADNIVFLRYLEIAGEMRKAIGVLKKRLSSFEKTIREIEMTKYGIKIGRPLTDLRGILTGTPLFIDKKSD